MAASPQSATMAKIRQVQELMANANLVKVIYGVDNIPGRPDTRGVRVVVRSGNPELRESLDYPGPNFPSLKKGETQLKFGDGYQHAEVATGESHPAVAGEVTELQGGAEDPGFQRWLDQHLFDLRQRTRILDFSHAVKWTAVGGEGQETEWTAIFPPELLGMGSPQRETVGAPGA
jgi:hypothetical protein